ncbi:putative orphan protein [Moritella sp. PE36]|nr:putative orphan protein [Moritella sp. PE36]
MSLCNQHNVNIVVEGEGFEPSKAEPSDLQSDPFGHSGTPPQVRNG